MCIRDSLHTEFQSNSTSPSIRLFEDGNNKNNNNNNKNNKRKVNENSGNLVPSLLRVRESADARAKIIGKKFGKKSSEENSFGGATLYTVNSVLSSQKSYHFM